MSQFNFSVMFRCDASNTIGSGHVMRCLSLAKRLSDLNIKIYFLTNAGGEEIIINSKLSITVVIIDSNESELQTIKRIVQIHSIHYLVWDSYELTQEHENEIADYISTLIIDDTYLLPFYRCDAILNQNVYADSRQYITVNSQTALLTGSKYSLIRKEFLEYIDKTKKIENEPKKVLITFGGADPSNETLKFFQWIKEFKTYFLNFTIVLGAHYIHDEHPYQEGKSNSFHKVTTYRNVTSMAPLLWEQDLVITAAGSTMYELAMLGIPSLCMITAPNQLMVAEKFSQLGASINIGHRELIEKKAFLKYLEDILKNSKLRNDMSVKGKQIVDGQGANRVADFIIQRMNGKSGVNL